MVQEWPWAGPVSKNTAPERKKTRKTKQRGAPLILTKTKTKCSVWTRSTLFSFANPISLFLAPKRLETTACFWEMSEKRGILRIGAMFCDSSAISNLNEPLVYLFLPLLGHFLFFSSSLSFLSSLDSFFNLSFNKSPLSSGCDILRSQGSNSKQRNDARMVRWRWRRRRSSCQVSEPPS